MTLTGPELVFTAAAVIAVAGAPVSVSVDGEEKPMWSRLVIQAGQKLKIGKVGNGGLRFYLAVRGGFPEMWVRPGMLEKELMPCRPLYLGSKAGTASLGFGGTQVSSLQASRFWLHVLDVRNGLMIQPNSRDDNFK